MTEVEAKIANLGLRIERLAGKDRKGTSDMIAWKRWKMVNPDSQAITDVSAVVDGYNFADALSAAPFVAQFDGGSVGFHILSVWLNHPGYSGYDMVFGGTTVIPKGEAEKYRYAGANRYETAVEVAKAYKDFLKLDIDTVVLVSGEDFPDGLTAAEIAGVETAAVLLTQKGVLSPTTKAYIEGNANIKNVIILGGEAAVSEAVEKELKTIKVTAPTAKTEAKAEAKAEDKAKAKTDVKTETVKEEPKGEVVVDSAVNND